jgi:fibronectin-binding autotransporter adhesin
MRLVRRVFGRRAALVCRAGSFLLAGLLAVAGQPVDVRAEIFNAGGNLFVGGTTTLSTGTTGDDLYVGLDTNPAYLDAKLNVVAGGSVTTSGRSFIGGNDQYTGVGTVTVTSGGSINTPLIGIGWNGNGTLNVNGGYVQSPAVYIGNESGSVGTATISSGTWAIPMRDSVNGGYVLLGLYPNTVGTLNVSGGYVGGAGGANPYFAIGYDGVGLLNVTGGYVAGSDCDLSAGDYSGQGAIGAGTATVSGGTFALDGSMTVGVYGSGTLSISGGGLVSVAGVLQQGGSGTINLNSGGTLKIGGLDAAALANNGNLVFNNGTGGTSTAAISGTGTLTKQGVGTLTLSASSSYTGDTTISGGLVALGNANGFGNSSVRVTSGSISGNLINNKTVIFEGSDASTYSASMSGTGTLAKAGAGTLTLNGTSSFSGGTSLNAGMLAVGGTSALGSGPLSLNGGTLKAAAGGGSLANAVSLNANTTIAGSDALTIGGAVTLNGFNTLAFTNTARTTISGQIGESTPSILIKQGGGELELTGANTYTGGTFIQSGTVRINNSTGSAFGVGAVTVASGATLTGAGSISGAVQMNGTWAPGNSPGLVTIDSNVVLNGILDMELGGLLRATSGTGGSGYYDAINVTNALTLGGTLNVVLYDTFVPTYGDTFTLLQAGSISGDFDTVIYPTLSGGLSWERTTSATAMTITVVPEPSTYAMALAGLACGGWQMWRRRLRQASTLAA